MKSRRKAVFFRPSPAFGKTPIKPNVAERDKIARIK